ISNEFEKRNIPWAHVFGNHDAESGYEVRDQQEVYESFEWCVSKRGDEDIHGTGNYVLPVRSSTDDTIVYNVWGLDSHRNIFQFVEEGGVKYDDWSVMVSDPLYPCQKYDSLRFDQLMWYWNTSIQLEKYSGKKIPGMMFFHTPTPEFVTLYKNVAETKYRGNRREAVGCGPVNTGVFATVFQRGDVKTIVCGHDHINDFQGEYLGLTLAMDGGLNYDCYCDDDLRGGRIVDVDENDPWNVKTFMVRSKDYVKDYPVGNY
ncbi:MAG: metallophosphoesterase, partial [Clostridia bacterium]|nr:metallophosphoesterase [Clostridia bacterium]